MSPDSQTLTHYPQNGQSLQQCNSEDSDSDEEGVPSWAILGGTNENPALSLANELMAVDPTFLMPPEGEMEVLAEVEVLRKERGVWDEERVRLEQEKRGLRQTKEGLERCVQGYSGHTSFTLLGGWSFTLVGGASLWWVGFIHVSNLS